MHAASKNSTQLAGWTNKRNPAGIATLQCLLEFVRNGIDYSKVDTDENKRLLQLGVEIALRKIQPIPPNLVMNFEHSAIDCMIGYGSFGQVWKAEFAPPGKRSRPVALKQLDSSIGFPPSLCGRSEISSLAPLLSFPEHLYKLKVKIDDQWDTTINAQAQALTTNKANSAASEVPGGYKFYYSSSSSSASSSSRSHSLSPIRILSGGNGKVTAYEVFI
ncbi:unnamed protein product [Orchesella dallaii]|uniref:Protein kinase domain-containing protein n=1 Tax=Orchesella dallaii TaxID=48710 RepID=A0ABP1S7Y1_9HEXA